MREACKTPRRKSTESGFAPLCRSGGEIDRRGFCASIAAVAAASSVKIAGRRLILPDEASSGAAVPDRRRPLIDKTAHRMHFGAAQDMGRVASCSVDLVVTSPPYPMIEMWDGVFAAQSPGVAAALESSPDLAFELMHQELDKVWKECFRVLKNGGFMCVNVGDATRTLNKEFRLHNNHSRIVSACSMLGFLNLPNIVWRKQTNAPNKFMGSGMLPCGAYVTLEHEWILVFRKGGRRAYKSAEEKDLRRASAFFWEERNNWFSDVWDVKGAKQAMANAQTRARNASFPLEIPYRLVNMFSQMGDLVLDPFAGMGTTMIAAMIAGRNSIGFEIDSGLKASIRDYTGRMNVETMRRFVHERVARHLRFVKEREESGKEMKYANKMLGCKVMTAQETDMEIVIPAQADFVDGRDFLYNCGYQALNG